MVAAVSYDPHMAEDAYIADVMLGKLARWLRILGYDVEYDSHAEDDDLADRVEETGRTLITRDSRLARRRAVRDQCVLLTRNDPFDQLKECMPHLARPPGLFTRCVVCNRILEAVDKNAVRSRVPPFVFRTQDRFVRCPACNRIYWPGTHGEQAVKKLRDAGIV